MWFIGICRIQPQRKEVMKRKVRSVAWAFDPMQPMNAYFNLGKLGVRAGAYKENYYGETTSLGSSTPLDSDMVFSHSVEITGLTGFTSACRRKIAGSGRRKSGRAWIHRNSRKGSS